MAKVTLIGLARRRQQFQLPHGVYCEAAGECRCQDVTVRTLVLNPKTGERLTRMVSHRVPGTIEVPYKGQVEIDEAILRCPGVRAALNSRPRKLRLTR